MNSKFYSLFLAVMILVYSGCAETTPPLQDMKIAKMALLNADEAQESTEASRYFKLAQNALIKAQQKMQEKRYDEARYLAQKATADARLAKIKAENEALQHEVEKLEGELRRLQGTFATIEKEEGGDAE